MPAKRLSMRKIKEVLRLKFELGFGHRQIARSCGINHGTVGDYIRRAEAAGLEWPLPEALDESGLEARLFPPQATPARDGAAAELPDEWGLPVEDVNGLMALYSWVAKAAKPERFEPEAPMASG